MTGVLSKVTNR